MAEDTNFEFSFTKTTELIDLYQQFPCLYDTTCKEYRNQHLRSLKIKEFSNIFGCSEDEIKKKLKNLRDTYVREKSKVKKKKSGDGLDDSYKSKWPFFDQLQFLCEFVTAKKTVSNMETFDADDSLITRKDEENDNNEDNSENETESVENVSASTKRPLPRSSINKIFSKKQKMETCLLEKAVTTLDAISSNRMTKTIENSSTSEDIFGKFVADSLKNIQSSHVKRLMQLNIQRCVLDGVSMDFALPGSGAQASGGFVPGQMMGHVGFPSGGMGQVPSGYPSSGMGQVPSAYPSGGMGQVPSAYPSGGMGQVPSAYPSSGMGQVPSSYPSSGMGQVAVSRVSTTGKTNIQNSQDSFSLSQSSIVVDDRSRDTFTVLHNVITDDGY